MDNEQRMYRSVRDDDPPDVRAAAERGEYQWKQKSELPPTATRRGRRKGAEPQPPPKPAARSPMEIIIPPGGSVEEAKARMSAWIGNIQWEILRPFHPALRRVMDAQAAAEVAGLDKEASWELVKPILGLLLTYRLDAMSVGMPGYERPDQEEFIAALQPLMQRLFDAAGWEDSTSDVTHSTGPGESAPPGLPGGA